MALALLAATSLSAPTHAASPYDLTTLVFFGDSLTDEGRAGQTAPVMWPGVLRNDLSVTLGTNYAIGGAITSNQPSAVFGDSSYLGQINSFVTAGGSSDPKTGAGIWIGTNNIWLGASQGKPTSTVVNAAAADVATGIAQLKTSGVSTFILLGVYDLSLTNAYKLAGTDTIATRNAAAVSSEQYNSLLSQISVSGTTIVYFNIANYINYLQVNAATFGFTRILPLQPGQTCDSTCQQTSIFTDTIHLTSRAQQLIGDYVATGDPIYNSANFTYGAIAENVESAAVAVPLSSYLARSAGLDLVRSTFARLDSLHGTGTGTLVPLYRPERPGAIPSPWSVFAAFNADGGNLTGAGLPADVSHVLGGLTAGADYAGIAGLHLGSLFNYAHSESDLTSSAYSDTKLDAFHVAAYLSSATSYGFIDGIVGIGYDTLAQTRTGSFGQVSSNPNGMTYLAAAHAGRLFDFGSYIRVGPVVGLSYVASHIGAYGEGGATLSTLNVAAQTSKSLVGSIGIQLKPASRLRWTVDPTLTVTYENEFLKQSETIATSLGYLPTQTLPTSAIAGQNAVRVAFGADYAPTPVLSAAVSAYGLVSTQNSYALGLDCRVGYHF